MEFAMIDWIKLNLSKFITKLRTRIDAFLQNTHDHYLCQLPADIGLLATFVLKTFYSGITVSKEQTLKLKDLHKDGIVVYTDKHKNFFNYLFYYIRYKQEGLPYPQIGFDYNVIIWQPLSRFLRILLAHLDYFFSNLKLPDLYRGDYLKNELVKGRPALLSLVEKKGFYRILAKAKTDPIRYLVELQKTIDRPIFIVPQLIFFIKDPKKSTPNIIDLLFGSKENPGKIRRLIILFKNPGRVFVEISEPVNLQTFLKLPENCEKSIEYLALALRRNLLVQINRHRQSITGPALKTSEELKQTILTSERLQSFMAHYSEARNIPIHKAHKESDGYLDEIAAKYNMVIIKMASVMITWVLKTMFEGVTVNEDGLNRVKNMSQKGPLILVPCHKSHVDYLILSYLLYNNNMPCPLIAAGKNLAFWPIGPLFRGCGAFFIRRTFKGAVLYSKVFAEYVHTLLEEGFNLEFFIEGGRSRTGKLTLPKLGLLSILLNCYKNGACQDMIFTPIFIGYDRVLEESSYLNEIEGEQKQPESLRQVIKARKFLKKRYGRIYIQFHDPISFKELLEQYGTPIEKMPSKELNVLCRNLGHRIINAINQVSVVTPHALVAAAVMNCSKTSFTYEHLMSHIDTYLSHLYSKEAKLADTLLIDHVHAVEHALDTFMQRKFVECLTKDKEPFQTDALFKVNESKRPNLEYYKNNCIAFFVPAAITALSILIKDAFQFSASDLHADYKFIQYFFKYEFAYDVDRTPEDYVRKNLKAFIDDAILMPHPTLPDTYNLTSAGFRKLKFFASFLKTYFESYWIVLEFFRQHSQNSIKPKERFKKIDAIGYRMYKQKEIDRKEALSRINYSNGVDFFTTNGVKGSEDYEKTQYYTDAIQKYINYL
jgi:glycerol-3-phosphate O-acyltransferase